LQAHQRKDALIDSTAFKQGIPMLTGHRTDFVLLRQLAGKEDTLSI
jgi:hypothetical protein